MSMTMASMGSEPSSPPPHHPKPTTPRASGKITVINDGLVFALGATAALVIFWAFTFFFSPSATPIVLMESSRDPVISAAFSPAPQSGETPAEDPLEKTYFDDPSVSYNFDNKISDWDEERREWLRLHPNFADGGGRERVLMVSGSQATPCHNPIGDHLLLRFFKNKVDYCRRHGIELFYNTALLHPAMFTYWAKYPLVRAAMLAHPEAEWIWWVDSDAALTDMDFELPLDRYTRHNLVVNGWPDMVYKKRSWVSLNAGVFLIRNCQWSLDFMNVWAGTGPQTPEYENWGKVLRSELSDKLWPESDDQSALVYFLLKEKDKWGSKIYLEDTYYFQGYWAEIVGRLDNITNKYKEMERKAGPEERRRHAEKVTQSYGRRRQEMAVRDGARTGVKGWQRPFITHFTGCQPCSGDHNKMYSGENCFEGMKRALNFADDQVLRDYGFRHTNLTSDDVKPLPFDYPAAE